MSATCSATLLVPSNHDHTGVPVLGNGSHMLGNC